MPIQKLFKVPTRNWFLRCSSRPLPAGALTTTALSTAAAIGVTNPGTLIPLGAATVFFSTISDRWISRQLEKLYSAYSPKFASEAYIERLNYWTNPQNSPEAPSSQNWFGLKKTNTNTFPVVEFREEQPEISLWQLAKVINFYAANLNSLDHIEKLFDNTIDLKPLVNKMNSAPDLLNQLDQFENEFLTPNTLSLIQLKVLCSDNSYSDYGRLAERETENLILKMEAITNIIRRAKSILTHALSPAQENRSPLQ